VTCRYSAAFMRVASTKRSVASSMLRALRPRGA
jgi:hypothetical protein